MFWWKVIHVSVYLQYVMTTTSYLQHHVPIVCIFKCLWVFSKKEKNDPRRELYYYLYLQRRVIRALWQTNCLFQKSIQLSVNKHLKSYCHDKTYDILLYKRITVVTDKLTKHIIFWSQIIVLHCFRKYVKYCLLLFSFRIILRKKSWSKFHFFFI